MYHGLPALTSERWRTESQMEVRGESIRSTLGGARRRGIGLNAQPFRGGFT